MVMSVKMIITERQLSALKQYLNENSVYESMVETMVKDLNTNYKPMVAAIREDGEYHEMPMFEVLIDGNEITPKELYEYMKKKYNTSDEFTKQVIKDWAFGTLKGNQLSKNVSLS
jgi:hypothetical protein